MSSILSVKNRTKAAFSFASLALMFWCILGIHMTEFILQVCQGAGVEPHQISYIEAHGTGTVVGDGQELGAIDKWYGTGAGRSEQDPLLIGSVKSNMGHCEGCSGLAGTCSCCAQQFWVYEGPSFWVTGELKEDSRAYIAMKINCIWD